MPSLHSLPTELVEIIFFKLSARDILVCSSTCQYLRLLVLESSLLQLIIELAVSGLRLRNHANGTLWQSISVHDRLNALRRSETRWRNLNPKYIARIPLEQFEYEVCDGLFGHGISIAHPWFRGIEINRIGLSDENQSCPVWRRYDDVGIFLADFSFDLASDLLVLAAAPIQHRTAKDLHLRTLSSNVDHPLVTYPILRGPGSETWLNTDIKIAGTYLAVHFGHPTFIGPEQGRLCIWEWQTGDLLHTTTSTSGFAFLSPASVAATFFIEEENGDAVTEIGLFRIGSKEPIVELELPFRAHPTMCSVLSDRPLVDAPSSLSNHSPAPFMADETAAKVFVLQMDNFNRHIFVAVKPLLELLDAGALRSSNSAIPHANRYSWTEWGPPSTFWLQSHVIEPGYTSVSGSRVCAVSHIKQLFDTNVPSGEENMGIVRSCTLGTENVRPGATTILVMDFNMRSIEYLNGRAGRTDLFAPNIRWEIDVEGETMISTLPFRAFQIEQVPYIEAIVTPDHIIGIRDTQDGTVYEVLQFTE
ncbi:SubName: Full=Uncharacterized protein {ECO:0000313/EMBL:CCA70791.1} [Serendipita indica DSM 11827]|nr:SubName: Full=Uncharacterized protein {ECO:0000313/EMBL:CCA70791.1} [Serendipita indica DSM 11827]